MAMRKKTLQACDLGPSSLRSKVARILKAVGNGETGEKESGRGHEE